MRSNQTHENDIIDNLEELGLSKYESSAYLTLIQKGSLAPSEIAYYSNLPRTKVYSVLKKLEKKKLSVISQEKPLIFSPIPPEEAFHEILQLSERRIKNMKKIVETLQRISDEFHRPVGCEEKRYTVLNAKSAFLKVNELIAGCKASINASLDTWGVRFLSQCKDSIVKAMTNNVKFRLLVGYDSLDDECLLTMPEDITVRIGDIRSSRIIIDSVSMILMDSKNGKAALFNSLDVIGVSYIRHFEEDWANASQVNLSKNTDMALAMKATKLVKVMKEFLYSQPFVQSFDSPSDDPRSILNILERNGVKSLGENPEEIVRIIDHSLKLTSYGTIKYDKNNSGIIMRCLVEKRKIFPWAMLLCLSMDQKGCKSKIIQNLDSLEDVIYIKLAKPIP
jgi:sugar-specific transcriptional regulator TrmB